ncbi:MAG: hypothetical protein AB2704_01225, partial [Candidatus Thiodiazotropha taylori]
MKYTLDRRLFIWKPEEAKMRAYYENDSHYLDFSCMTFIQPGFSVECAPLAIGETGSEIESGT